MDGKLTEEIAAWLNGPQTDVAAGAELMLRLNRNRILYANALRKPDALRGKVVYELKKYLRIRLDGLTTQQVAAMDAEVKRMPPPPTDEQARKGQRPDHEGLPAAVRALFDRAHELLVQMRPLHERLKLMEKDKPCDRYPFLKELIKLDRQRHEALNAYDAWRPGEATKEGEARTTAETLKTVSAARSFLSANIKTAEGLEGEEREALVEKIRERVKVIEESGGGISAYQLNRLRKIGAA